MIDFKKLYGIFIEEAMERVAELESGLLQLEEAPQDKELLNTIFRAAHTIKGSSGTIGLTDISHFTHAMEEALDLIRQDKLSPEKEVINVFLEATDLIRAMIECVAAETAFEPARCADLEKRLKDMKGSNAAGPIQAQEEGNTAGDGPSESTVFIIKFIPGSDLFKRGIDPSIIINDLAEIGELVDIKAYTDAVPMLSELNPEKLYLRWDMQLKTDRTEEDVKKVFEFVEEGSEIRIFPMKGAGRDLPFIGQMLVEEGIVKAEDVDDALKSRKRLGEILLEKGKITHKDIEKAVERQVAEKTESVKNSISSTIRVDLKKLDHLINTVGEMVIIHSMFQQTVESSRDSVHNETAERLDVISSQLQRIGKNIQESAMSLRMLPVGEIFRRFTRLVRELSVSKNKNIELIISGEDTELDKGVLEKITDPLVHLIRNSIDHGIETAGERASSGKALRGTIHLSAYQMGDSVYMEIEDDGRGLNKGKLLEKAVSSGILSSTAGLTDDEIFNLIFLPGFSTADKVTDVSGRGVGMDVVKKNIESLNGRVYIYSKPGTGTTISIKLPLTLAIIDGLTVLIGDESFIIPISLVAESMRPARKDIKTLNEKGEVVNVRGEYVPLLRLHDLLCIPPGRRDPWEAIVIVTTHEDKKYCLLADELTGQQQVVIKNLGTATPKIRGIAGGTILGDGKVALVLDVPGIIELNRRYEKPAAY